MKRVERSEHEGIRNQLERILQSEDFRASDKQRKFLSFVVNETLEGRSSDLKGYTIAIEVYGRAAGFDPQVDPIVRVEAGRLRRALEHYYLTGGKSDPLRISIPKGGYVPTFQVSDAPVPGPEGNGPQDGASIAVMPLADLTGDKEHEYFTDGLTEELTAELARYQDFRVIASQSTLRFKGQGTDPVKVGRDLNVRFLLTGNVRRDTNTVKISVQLVDTVTAEQIWGKSYRRDFTAAELIGMQEEIAQLVIGVIADQWGLIERRLSRECSRKAPSELTAYEAVLRFYHYETVLTAEAFEQALEALKGATETEPDYGIAWSMLGHLHADNYALGFREVDEPLEKALTYAKKGVSLEPESQFAWDALAVVYFHLGDKEPLLETIEKTLRLNPNSPYIVGVAGWHMMLYGEWDHGLELLRKGMELNPYYPSWFHLASFMNCYRLEDHEGALAEALKFNYPGLFWDPVLRASALVRLGRKKEATAAVGELLELVPDFATRGRKMISGYLKIDSLAEQITEGLREAGLADLA